MKYLVNHTDVMAMREVLNIALKAKGLQALDEIIALSQSINIDNQAESGVIELTPEQVTVLIDAMDTTLRVKGLEVAYGILKLRNLLSNPLSENSEVENQIETVLETAQNENVQEQSETTVEEQTELVEESPTVEIAKINLS